VALAVGYMLSRGIAKAGKGPEGRWG
jgi:hypothetical protein